jgi:hypothetical protein
VLEMVLLVHATAKSKLASGRLREVNSGNGENDWHVQRATSTPGDIRAKAGDCTGLRCVRLITTLPSGVHAELVAIFNGPQPDSHLGFRFERCWG